MATSRSLRAEIRVELPRRAETVRVIRHLARDVLEAAGVTSETIEDIEIALSEACANAVIHTSAGDGYDVVLALDRDVCEIDVADSGPGFEEGGSTRLAPERVGGRGLAIMRAVMDEVEIRSALGAPTTVHLSKSLAPSGTSHGSPESLEPRCRDLLVLVAGASARFAETIATLGGAIA